MPVTTANAQLGANTLLLKPNKSARSTPSHRTADDATKQVGIDVLSREHDVVTPRRCRAEMGLSVGRDSIEKCTPLTGRPAVELLGSEADAAASAAAIGVLGSSDATDGGNEPSSSRLMTWAGSKSSACGF